MKRRGPIISPCGTQLLFSLKTENAPLMNTVCSRKALWAEILDLFRLCPPSTLCSPVTEYVSLHSKSLCKNIARSSGGCK